MLMQQKMTGAISATSELRPKGTAAVAPQASDGMPGRMARISDRRWGATTDYATAYLWLESGQSWPFLRSFETITNRALCGWLFVVAACACWAMIMMMTGGTRPDEATLQMEQLAEKLESTTAIPTATANAVARVLGQPGYDCRQVGCSAQLAERNRTARARLQNVVANKGPSNGLDLSASKSPRAAAAEVGH
jgi:hypothetical protein